MSPSLRAQPGHYGLSPTEPNHAGAEREFPRKVDRLSAGIFGKNWSMTARPCTVAPVSRNRIPSRSEGTDLCYELDIKRRGRTAALPDCRTAALRRPSSSAITSR